MALSPQHWGSCHVCSSEVPPSYFSGYYRPNLVYEQKWRNTETENVPNAVTAGENYQEKNEEKSEEAKETRNRRKRASYKRWQLDILEDAFEANCYPSTMLKKFLARRLHMENIQVQVWFQNRRARMKKDGNGRHFSYGRNYPPTIRYDSHCLNPIDRRTTYPYFTNYPAAYPMFSGYHLDRVLSYNHPEYHMCPSRAYDGYDVMVGKVPPREPIGVPKT